MNVFNTSGWLSKSEDFVVGQDSFSDLQINSAPTNEKFYYFYNTNNQRLIRYFVLDAKQRVDYICQVTLIKNGASFTPRLSFSVRDKSKKIVQVPETQVTNIKANVILDYCHDNFWKLILFLQTIREIETPSENFTLMSQEESEIVAALQGRGTRSIVNIIKLLLKTDGVQLTQEDLNQLMNRRAKLQEFRMLFDGNNAGEKEWQDFFEENKWIFGYGLDYQVLRQEQAQPHYGGTRVEGAGGQRGDFLTSTHGNLNFTVLVEIKTPETPLLHGTSEIRNGAWSLSKDLTDAITQIEANIATWEQNGSKQDDNRDRFESHNIFTVKPKGIIVIGNLSRLDERSKRETFERFRKSIHGVDIVTFDELYKRAKFIVEND